MTHILYSKLNCLCLRAGRAWSTNQIHTNRSSLGHVVGECVRISIGKDNGCTPLLQERYMAAEQNIYVALLSIFQNVCKFRFTSHWF